MGIEQTAGEVGNEHDLGTSDLEVGLTGGLDTAATPSNDFVVAELQRLLRTELANPGARRKQGPVVLRDPRNPSVSVKLDDLVPGHLGGYKSPLVRREYGDNKTAGKATEKGKKPLVRREYREKIGSSERRIGGIDESKLMVAKLRAALLAVSNGGNQ